MPVVWHKADGTKEITHAGLVLSNSWSNEVRVMSDVWAYEYKCLVWNPGKGEAESLSLGVNFDGADRIGDPTIDAPEPIRILWEAKQEEARVIRAQKDAEERELNEEQAAKEIVLFIQVGALVEVVKGNKVPHGTRGKCTGLYPDNYGRTRVGILDSKGNKHFTSKTNVVGVISGEKVGYVPAGGWRKFLAVKQAEEQAAAVFIPKKKDRVRRIKDGVEGVVFWVKMERLGFKAPGSEEAQWANADEVEILDSLGKPKHPPAPAPAPAPLVFEERSPFESYPFPYCNIRGIIPPVGDSADWTAVDESGELVVILTKESAEQLIAIASENF